MAQRILLFVPSDDEPVSMSPLTYIDTLYYELQYRIVGTTGWTPHIEYSPLPLYTSVSPAGEIPYISIPLLPDNTDFEYQLRRFNSDNQPSDWFTGTFTTGVSA